MVVVVVCRREVLVSFVSCVHLFVGRVSSVVVVVVLRCLSFVSCVHLFVGSVSSVVAVVVWRCCVYAYLLVVWLSHRLLGVLL